MVTKKRANGEGTITKRTDGRYHGAAFVPMTGGGRRRVFVYGRTRKEARDKLDAVLRDAADGIPRARERQTVCDYLDYWLEHVAKPELRGSTYAGYAALAQLGAALSGGLMSTDDVNPTGEPDEDQQIDL